MRDLRKIKSKYEFKLDNKQIAFLLVGVLMILVVVFALGVVVGKGLVQIQSIEAGLDLQKQVESGLPATPEPEPMPSAPGPEDEGYVNLLVASPTPTTEAPVEEPLPVMTPVPTPEPTPEPTPAPLPPTSTEGKFTIQLSSHPNMTEAENARAKYLAKGLTDVFIGKAEVKGSTWYRVRSGSFATKQGAQQFANAIKAKGIVATPWVTAK